MLAVALALGSSLAWGVADFMGGLAARRLALLLVLLGSQLVGLALMGLIVAARAEGPPESAELLLAAGSALAGVGGLAAFYRGLAVGAMAVVAPISATAAVVPVAVGVIAGERPSTVQAVGIVLAVCGVVLAAREEAPEEEGRNRVSAGAGLALLAALGFGSFFVLIDAASEGDVLWALLVNRVSGVALLGALAAALRPSLEHGTGDLRLLAAIGVFDVAANTMFAVASTQGLVSIVGVCGSLYPVVTVSLARLVLAERVRPGQLTGVAVALAGVAAISAG